MSNPQVPDHPDDRADETTHERATRLDIANQILVIIAIMLLIAIGLALYMNKAKSVGEELDIARRGDAVSIESALNPSATNPKGH